MKTSYGSSCLKPVFVTSAHFLPFRYLTPKFGSFGRKANFQMIPRTPPSDPALHDVIRTFLLVSFR